ncbi:transcriptional regulator, ArgR family [Pilibacter termitis]|uniref:Arginine repressor n=1 Tax=Pilibacter termitis TaxID=263852 RepID=A0A1T4NRI9_9ENTE|nr:hypothetical protein [Pilibacter termitis]SJZ81869.1 transcriptional regulator, ArgR family [Pilibacter termitis]
MKKTERQQLILEFISTKKISSQEEIVSLLEKRGLYVAQATISRDIHELNIVKVVSKTGGLCYERAIQQSQTEQQTIGKSPILQIERLNNQIFLTTLPGNAYAKKREFREILEDIFAMISDDDSLLLTFHTENSAKKAEQILLKELL